MNLTPFYSAVRLRMLADTTTGGLFASGANLVTGVYTHAAPRGTVASVKPYIVTTFYTAGHDDAFRLDLIRVEVQVHIVADAAGGYEIGETIRARVYGDAAQPPTYGLHRWTPTLTGTFSGQIITHAASAEDHDEDTLHWIDTYTTFIQRAVS